MEEESLPREDALLAGEPIPYDATRLVWGTFGALWGAAVLFMVLSALL